METLSKLVQEIDLNGEDVPEQYVYSMQDAEAINSGISSVNIPVIDVSLLSIKSAEGDQELKKIQSALGSWGCFQAVNHGIPSSILNDVHEVTKRFFQLPIEEKLKYSRPVDGNEGYGSDRILSDDQVLNWCDRLYIIVLPEDQRTLKVWPENPSAFWGIVHDYAKHLEEIYKVILKAMARSLSLKENCFLDQYGKRGFMQARFNLYPRCPRPDSVLGLKPHADGSVITMVLQDKVVEGLQFLKEDQWFKASLIPDALLINLGDQAEIMSNGIFKSPVHRVLTNSDRERISLAVFCLPDPEREIHPAEELVIREGQRHYKRVKGYVNNYFEYYQQGKRPIDAVKL